MKITFMSGWISRTWRTSAGPSMRGITTSVISSRCGSVGIADQLERRLAALRLDHLVALVAQRAGAENPHRVLVLDQHDRADPGQIAGAPAPRPARRGRRLAPRRPGGAAGRCWNTAPSPGALLTKIKPPVCLTMP